MSVNKNYYEEKFNAWVKKQNVEIAKSVKGLDLKVGDIVDFTNEFGVKFKGYKILGFEPNADKDSRCVYLNWESYWFAAKPEKLEKVK